MRRSSFVWTVALTAGVHCVQAAAVQGDTGDIPPLPKVSLAGLAGLDEDRSYAKSVARQAAEFSEQAERTGDLSTRIDLLLRAANIILANEIEPVCTIRLSQLEVLDPPGRDAAVSDALDRADGLLATVRGLLESHQAEPGEDPQAEPPWAPRRRLEMLQAFARALRAYLLGSADPDAIRTSRQAASRLSVLLEEDNRQIAAAAGLWQACLRSLDSDPSRALALLDPALADLPRNSLPFSHFARLLRCRLIAAQGNYATALALLTQMEEQFVDWFPDEEERDDALRAAALLQIQVLLDWHGTLTGPSRVEERQWCIDRAARIAAEHFTEERHSVFRLNPCVPLLTAPPNAKNNDTGASPDDG